VAGILRSTLLGKATRPAVIADLTALVDAEVAGKGGVSGAVIKAGYAAVKKVKPGFVNHAVGALLPRFVDALDPLWAEYRTSGSSDFGKFLAGQPDRAADTLLSVTDARARATGREALKKGYDKLRPNAKKHVTEALPGLGTVIERHAAE
jgi:hypothetical protein